MARLFLILFVILIFALVTVFLILRTLLYGVWVFTIMYFKEFYADLWLSAPEPVRREIRVADKFGLFHNLGYLSTIGPKSFCKKSINEMQLFADVVTIKSTKSGDNKEGNTQALLSIAEGVHSFNTLNATALGNMAYVALHHKNPLVRRKYSELIEQIKEHFNSFR